ncbi:MAG: hypothetical protein WD451_03365 [Thermoanaerobaculia bacterium]
MTHHEGSGGGRGRPLHKDWRVWVVIGLMLAAMAVYTLSEDDSSAPGQPETKQPAAPPPP